MGGKCQTMDTVYDCHFTSPESQKIYFGLTEGKWKKRYHNYKKSFNDKRYSHGTTTLDVTPNLRWSAVRCATPYSNISEKVKVKSIIKRKS